jgi:hypothetical protein
MRYPTNVTSKRVVRQVRTRMRPCVRRTMPTSRWDGERGDAPAAPPPDEAEGKALAKALAKVFDADSSVHMTDSISDS